MVWFRKREITSLPEDKKKTFGILEQELSKDKNKRTEILVKYALLINLCEQENRGYDLSIQKQIHESYLHNLK